MSYEEERKEVEVPPATGVPGYLRMIERILQLPRVQEVVLVPGKLSYRRFRKEGEPDAELDVDLSTLMPSQVIRSAELTELKVSVDHAASMVSQMFAQVHMDGFAPIAFVGGTSSAFFSWHLRTAGGVLPKTMVYGLPFLGDPEIPSEAFILCAAYTSRASLADTVRAYKISIPIFNVRNK